ncbi:MAG: tetratricopeptide repeat protein, partial [Planctomycetota bacterium]
IESLRFIMACGAWTRIEPALDRQAQEKHRQPVMRALRGACYGMLPEGIGTSQTRGQAISEFRAALEMDRAFPHALYLLGMIMLMELQATKNMDTQVIAQACSFLERALDLQPQFSDAHNQLGMGYTMLGRKAEALQHCFKAVEVAHADPKATEEQERAWKQLLGVIERFNAIEVLPDVEALMETYRPSARVRLVIYSEEARVMAMAGQYERAMDYVNKAITAAHEADPDQNGELDTSAWIQLYTLRAKLAVMLPTPDEDSAFADLQEAATLARKAGESRMMIIIGWREIGSQMKNPHLPDLLDVCMEEVARQKPDDRYHSTLVAVFSGLLENADLSKLDPARLRVFLGWSLGNGAPMLALTIRLAGPLVATAGEMDAALLESLIGALTTGPASAIESLEYRISLPGTDLLGRLLEATGGAYDARFIVAATSILGRAVSGDETTRKMNVCEVLQRHPIAQLAAPISAALTATAASGDTSACQRLFPVAHKALLAVRKPDDAALKDWKPDRSTPMDEYQRIAAAWATNVAG